MLPIRWAVCIGNRQSENSLMLDFIPYFLKAINYLRNTIPFLSLDIFKNTGIVHVCLNFINTMIYIPMIKAKAML